FGASLPTDRGVQILLGNGNGTLGMPVAAGASCSPAFGGTGALNLLPNVDAVAVVAADFNQDGILDLGALAHTFGSNFGDLTSLQGLGDGNFEAVGDPVDAGEMPVFTLGSGNVEVGVMAVGDLDRDGFPDVVIGNHSVPSFGGSFQDYVSV